MESTSKSIAIRVSEGGAREPAAALSGAAEQGRSGPHIDAKLHSVAAFYEESGADTIDDVIHYDFVEQLVQ